MKIAIRRAAWEDPSWGEDWMKPADYAAKLRETARLCAEGTISIADLFDVQRPIWLEVLEAGLQEAVLRELDDGGVEWMPVRETKAPRRGQRAGADAP